MKALQCAAVGFAILGSVFAMPNRLQAARSVETEIGEDVAGFEKTDVMGRIREEIARLEVRGTLDFVDGEVFNGVNAAIRYRYQLEPSYKGDYHLRMDRWQINVGVDAGDILADYDDVEAGLGLERGAEVLFVRPFKSKWDSAKALPYTPARMPFSAKRALEKLEVGDFVAFNSKLNLVVGASGSAGSVDIPITVATHYVISGEFQIHIFKMSDKKIRMKLISVRRRSLGGSVSIGYDGDSFSVTGLRIVDRRIEKMFDATEFFSAAIAKSSSKLVMIDYVLDLTSAPVAAAYDAVMKSALRFNLAKIADPLKTDVSLSGKLVSDLTPLENIYAGEKLKANEDRVADRLFKGQNDVENQIDTSFRFGLGLFKVGQDTQYIENSLTSVDENENKTYYKLHTYQRTRSLNFFFSYWKRESISRASLLYGADQNFLIQDIQNLVFEWDYRDKKITASEVEDARSTVMQSVPEAIYKKIQWGPWKRSTDHINGRVLMTSVVHPDAFSVIGSLSASELQRRFTRYLKSIPPPEAETADPFKRANYSSPPPSSLLAKYAYDIAEVANKLEVVFAAGTRSHDKRSSAFGDLREVPLFIEVGPGFLASLIPENELDRLLYFKLTMTADGVQPLNFEYGTLKDRKVYDAAAYIQAVLNNRDVDLAIHLAR